MTNLLCIVILIGKEKVDEENTFMWLRYTDNCDVTKLNTLCSCRESGVGNCKPQVQYFKAGDFKRNAI